MPARSVCERAHAIPHASPSVEPDNAEVLRALKSLSRRGALGFEIEMGCCVSVKGCDLSAASAQFTADVWRYIIQRGWCVPHETEAGWRISNAGRIALKRQLSRKGAPEDRAVTRQGLVRASSSPPPSALRVSPSQPRQNENESPLAWLRQRRDREGRAFISDVQFSAGERLRRDFTHGSLTPNVTSNWSPVAFSSKRGNVADKELELRDGQLRARERFRAAMAAVGPELSDVLADVCCFLHGLEDVERKNAWPRRTAKVVLVLGLSALARFYGLEGRR